MLTNDSLCAFQKSESAESKSGGRSGKDLRKNKYKQY